MVRWAKITIIAISLTFATFVWGSHITHNNDGDVYEYLTDQESNEALIEEDQNADLLRDDRVEDIEDFDSVIPSKTPVSNTGRRYYYQNKHCLYYLIWLLISVHC